MRGPQWVFKKEKRQPTLADTFVHVTKLSDAGVFIGRRRAEFIQARVRASHKFVFDTEASQRVAQVVHDIPDLILRESRFARAPFDLTWIEYDARTYWAVLMDNWQHFDYADTRVGFLIDHNCCTTIAEGKEEGGIVDPNIYPIQYHLNTEWPLEDQIKFAEMLGTSRIGIDMWMWGSSASHFMNRGEGGRMRELRDHNRADFICDPAIFSTTDKFLTGANGDMRTIIAFLLMLNRPTVTKYVHTLPNQRGFIKNKVAPYMKHTTIEVNLDAVQTLKLIGTPRGEGVPRRRHEVRGHYCHDETARQYMRIAGCIHSWQQSAGPKDKWKLTPNIPPDECNNWVCNQCGGKRWWKPEHHRGHGGVGFVIQDGYEVTTRGE